MTLMDISEKILKEAGSPLHQNEILRRATAKGLVSLDEKISGRSLGAQLRKDIIRNSVPGRKNRFYQSASATFGLTEWEETSKSVKADNENSQGNDKSLWNKIMGFRLALSVPLLGLIITIIGVLFAFYQVFPEYRPLPTPIPLPTFTPLPTATPLPTPTPLPTSTPLPTPTPLPTLTPTPEPCVVIFEEGLVVTDKPGIPGITASLIDRVPEGYISGFNGLAKGSVITIEGVAQGDLMTPFYYKISHMTLDGGELKIHSVVQDSPAQQAGLQPEDIIMQLDEVEIPNSIEANEYIYANTGKVIEFKVLRDGQQMTIPVYARKKSEWPEDQQFSIGIQLSGGFFDYDINGYVGSIGVSCEGNQSPILPTPDG